MPSDDPRCPECGGAVSATASYCLHCYADLDDDDGVAVESAVVDFRETSASAGGTPTESITERPDEPRSASTGAAPNSVAAGESTAATESGAAHAPGVAHGPGTGRADAGADEWGWFHPDGLLDDVSTGAVGIVAGLVVGFLAMVLALLATGSALAFLVGPIGWVGVGVYVGWTRSVFGAVRKACYLTAPTLAALPLFWFGDAPQGGDFGGRVVAFVISELVVLPVALVLVGIGYWIGGKARAPE